MVPAMGQVWYPIQQCDYVFLLISMMLIYIFLLLSITIILWFLATQTFLVEGLVEYCSFADARVITLKYIWMISWS